MRDFLIVLTYTFRENIRKTTFIVSTIIILILTIAIMIIPGLITNSSKSNTSNNDTNKIKSTVLQNFYIVDNINVLNKDVTPLKQA
ncbi:MAG TPA: ABC transporter permease, partial [Clostridia bacterium]|nr:ABC transporter permease [Clostridia bacterium]